MMRWKSTKTTRSQEGIRHRRNLQKRVSNIKIVQNVKLTVSGSFTVEAALLMTIMIPVLTALIYGTFYVHDNGVMQGIACELAAMGSNLAWEKDRTGELEKRKKALISSRFTDTRQATVSVSAGKDRVTVSGSGEFYFPGLVMRLFAGSTRKIFKGWSRELLRPAEKIRKVRGLEYVAESLD